MEKTQVGKRIVEWVRKHRIEAVLLVVILLLGAILRLYRISEYMTFLGDEGRDAIVVRNLLVYADPILIGPGTSVGNMYLGPLYYYLIAPFLFLFNFSPVGPSILIALFGIATVFLVWKITREWFPHSTRDTRSGLKPLEDVHVGALVAAFLYAISPVIIIYNRSSWNPNIMPFFSLLSVYAIWRIWKHFEWKWFIVLGISFAFVMQSHYLGLILLPILGLFWLLVLLSLRGVKLRGNFLTGGFERSPRFARDDAFRGFVKYSLLGLVVFLFLMSPLVIFDARHGWMNFGAIKTFFTVRQDTVSARPWAAIPKLWPLWEQVNTRLLGAGRLEKAVSEREDRIFVFQETLKVFAKRAEGEIKKLKEVLRDAGYSEGRLEEEVPSAKTLGEVILKAGEEGKIDQNLLYLYYDLHSRTEHYLIQLQKENKPLKDKGLPVHKDKSVLMPEPSYSNARPEYLRALQYAKNRYNTTKELDTRSQRELTDMYNKLDDASLNYEKWGVGQPGKTIEDLSKEVLDGSTRIRKDSETGELVRQVDVASMFVYAKDRSGKLHRLVEVQTFDFGGGNVQKKPRIDEGSVSNKISYDKNMHRNLAPAEVMVRALEQELPEAFRSKMQTISNNEEEHDYRKKGSTPYPDLATNYTVHRFRSIINSPSYNNDGSLQPPVSKLSEVKFGDASMKTTFEWIEVSEEESERVSKML